MSTGWGRMLVFDFTQDKTTLDRVGLLPNNTHTSLVRNLKTDPVITACCNSSNCNLTSGTPLGLSDAVKVMTNKCIDTTIHCSNWTMNSNLGQEAKDYGVFDVYVIWYIRKIVDQRLQALEVSYFLAQLSTYHTFRHVPV